MSGIREFFEMGRHERRGAIVVLVFIAVLMAASVLFHCDRTPSNQIQSVDIQQFEAEVDSTEISSPQPKSKSKSTKKHRRAAKPKQPKPSREPRRLDPVPQIDGIDEMLFR